MLKNIFSVKGVESIFLTEDFLSINKQNDIDWEDIKHIVLALLNEYYANGKEIIIDKKVPIHLPKSNPSLTRLTWAMPNPRKARKVNEPTRLRA